MKQFENEPCRRIPPLRFRFQDTNNPLPFRCLHSFQETPGLISIQLIRLSEIAAESSSNDRILFYTSHIGQRSSREKISHGSKAFDHRLTRSWLILCEIATTSTMNSSLNKRVTLSVVIWRTRNNNQICLRLHNVLKGYTLSSVLFYRPFFILYPSTKGFDCGYAGTLPAVVLGDEIEPVYICV